MKSGSSRRRGPTRSMGMCRARHRVEALRQRGAAGPQDQSHPRLWALQSNAPQMLAMGAGREVASERDALLADWAVGGLVGRRVHTASRERARSRRSHAATVPPGVCLELLRLRLHSGALASSIRPALRGLPKNSRALGRLGSATVSTRSFQSLAPLAGGAEQAPSALARETRPALRQAQGLAQTDPCVRP